MNKKPWPTDAVIIIAENAGRERCDQMQARVHTHCSDCGTTLMADSHTIAAAVSLPERKNRMIRFFCVSCATTYDVDSITKLVDDRSHKSNPATNWN